VRLKEGFCFVGRYRSRISIPSGAIKSKASGSGEYDLPIFQFLLVRLKVTNSVVVQRNGQISIPSGAIKRVNDALVKTRALELFQFLLVRLKAVDFSESTLLDTNFNSFWCD